MKVLRVALCLVFVKVVFLVSGLSAPVLAQEETVKLEATFPRVESSADDAVFIFAVDIVYWGDRTREFDLWTSGPAGWNTYVTSSYGGGKISVIRVEPGQSHRIKVFASPPPSGVTEAGDYRIILEAKSGGMRASIELTAVMMPTYSLELIAEPAYYREVTAGEDNTLLVTVKNTGSGELTDIRFSAEEPRDCIVELHPAEISRLTPGSFQEIEVNIRPAASMTDRYCNITLIAEASQVRATTIVRVHVEESNWLWGWIGGGIALVVIIGLVITFIRLGRSQ